MGSDGNDSVYAGLIMHRASFIVMRTGKRTRGFGYIRHEDLSGEFEVNGAGRIHLPLIQEVQAAGLTAQELEQIITDKLKPDYLKEPRVSVQVLTYRPFYILGEVNSPGSYSYVNGMTVVTAIARAGDSERKKQRADPNAPIYPGDVIEVPERLF
jgi:protein involved in polysaccharide export with SLBB domain